MIQGSTKWLALVVLLSAAGLIQAQDLPARNPNVDPLADSALRQMGEHLAAAKQLSFRAWEMVDEMYETGQKIQFSSMRSVVIRRPDRLASTVSGDLLNRLVVYDGKTLSILDADSNTYGRIDVPDTIDATLDFVAQRFGITVPLSDLLFSDPYGIVIDTVRTGRYLGIHHVWDIKCHHLAFQHDNLDWQIWIEEGNTPWPRKLVITYKALPGQPQFIALLDGWNSNPNVDDDTFKLVLPESATEVALEPMISRAKPSKPSSHDNPPDQAPGK